MVLNLFKIQYTYWPFRLGKDGNPGKRSIFAPGLRHFPTWPVLAAGVPLRLYAEEEQGRRLDWNKRDYQDVQSDLDF